MLKQLLEPNFFGEVPIFLRIIFIVVAIALLYFCVNKVTERDTIEICSLAIVLRFVICFIYSVKPIKFLSWASLAMVAVIAAHLWYKNKKNVLIGVTSAYEIIIASDVILFVIKWIGFMILCEIFNLL